MVWGENPVTVWTLCFLYIDVIQIVATVMESANTDGKLLGPILTVNINCWEAVFTVIFTGFTADFTVLNNCLPVAVFFGDFTNYDLVGSGSFESFPSLREGLQGGEGKRGRWRETLHTGRGD